MSKDGGRDRVIQIDVRNMQRKHVVDRPRISALAERALRAVGYEEAQLSIVIVNDRRMRDLNRSYRGRNAATDVLAFSQLEGEGAGMHAEVIGDVVISAETAAKQAAEAGKSLESEFELLAVHGVLHLAGFDHVGGLSEKAEMERWTKKILGGRAR
jgi:probable rRNA maturation factor